MSGHKIMVVDDNASTRRLVRSALTRRGHFVLEAPDARTARELMRTERPRVVLQDLVLPDADGFELVAQLRDLAGIDVSILAFSGYVSNADEARISAVGFDDIIMKPIAAARLIPIVEAHLPAIVPATERFGAGRRLVVADDDPLQLKLATFRLGRLGFDIIQARDGAAALDAIRRSRPDAVISDVMMPELDGFGLAMALRQDPDLRSLPLVLVTSSYVEPSDRALAQRAGANDLVVRTPDLTELIECLRATLARREPLRELEPDSVAELERERNRRVFRQLERQVLLNGRLAKRCSALAAELAVLTGIAEAVLTRRDLDDALDEAIASCFDAGAVSVGALFTLDAAGELRGRPLGGWEATGVVDFFGHDAVLRAAMSSGKVVYLPSDEVARDATDDLLRACEATSILIVPLASGGVALGALVMVARGRELEPAEWRGFGVSVAAQISQVLTLTRAYAEREAAEERAAQHAALLEAVVESAPDYVMQIDRDGVIGFVNRVLPPERVEDVVGKNWFERIAPDQRDQIRAAFDGVLATGEPAEFEIQQILPEGPRWFQGRFGPVRHGDTITACVMISRDVTDKKHTEMQLMLADRMASVGTLAAGVAHEINNPLASVIANLEMAIEDIEQLGELAPADVSDELRDARASADRVREIVRDLKMFSRTQDDHRGAVDVEKVLDTTLRMAWNEIRHRARVEKHYGKVPRVDANESRLGQVFLNLIVNAVQAIPEGNFENNVIRVETRCEGGEVTVTVSDTGTGISPAVQQRLFTPFFTTKPVGVGTGLGLAISHRIITSLGGKIAFESQIGKGTSFHVTLPVAGANVLPFTQKLPMVAKSVRRGRILVVDDEEPLAQAVKRYLSHDHEVEALTSARIAIERIATGQRYDVILCDVMMPQITGMELHAAVQRIDPTQADRIVFVTGGAFTPSARAFLERAPNQRIEKPFDLRTLRGLVNDLVR